MRLLSLLRGYVTLVVEGKKLERFINMAVSRGVRLWDITYLGNDRMLVRVRVYAVGALRHIAKRTASRFRIKKKSGLPFWLWRVRRRKAFYGGALFFAAALYFFFSFVWVVEVEGTKKIKPVAIRHAVAEIGLRPGVPHWLVDGKEVERHLKERFPGIAWVGVELAGGRARIKITEKKLPLQTPSGPAHIVARKAGLIKELLVLEGQPLVKEGDTVLPGQVLISGEVVPGAEGETGIVPGLPRYVRAKGIVKARVWYEAYGEAPLVERGERMGRKVRITTLRVGGREFRIRGPKGTPYARYKVKVTVKRPFKGRTFGAPVELITREITEVVPYVKKRTREEARQLAAERARQKVRAEVEAGASILNQKMEEASPLRQDAVRVRLRVEVLEDIGALREIKRR